MDKNKKSIYYFFLFRFERGAIAGSINIPFTSVQLAHVHLDTLGPQARPLVDNKESIVVIIGPNDQNNALVCKDSHKLIISTLT